jgi:hypothetical protein
VRDDEDAAWQRFWGAWRWTGPVLMGGAVAYAAATSSDLAPPVAVATMVVFGPAMPFSMWWRARRLAAWVRRRKG